MQRVFPGKYGKIKTVVGVLVLPVTKIIVLDTSGDWIRYDNCEEM